MTNPEREAAEIEARKRRLDARVARLVWQYPALDRPKAAEMIEAAGG
jgi:hypothetical protein